MMSKMPDDTILGPDADSWYRASSPFKNITEIIGTPPPSPYEKTIKCDICIIGGGFTGLSAAVELAKAGRDVVVVEARDIGFGASGRNGGQMIGDYHCSYKKIEKIAGSDIRKACFDISESGKKLIEDRCKEYKEKYNIDCHLKWGYGHLAVKTGHLDEMQEHLDDLNFAGYSHASIMDAGQLQAKLKSPRYLGALQDARSGHLHPLIYCQALCKDAHAHGARIFTHSFAHDIDCNTGRLKIKSGEKGGDGDNNSNGHTIDIQADNLIIAGNAYINLHPLVPKIYQRIMPVVSNIIATAPLEKEMMPILNDYAYADYNFIVDYFRMSHDNRFLFGGRASYLGLDPLDLKSWMQRRMVKRFPHLKDCRIDYAWGGRIGITFSRMPDLGHVGRRALYAQGYSGHGVMLSNICGKILAEAILGRQEKFDILQSFDHRRFPGGKLRAPALALGMLYHRIKDAI